MFIDVFTLFILVYFSKFYHSIIYTADILRNWFRFNIYNVKMNP